MRHVFVALVLVASAAAQFPGARRSTEGSWNYNNDDDSNGEQLPPPLPLVEMWFNGPTAQFVVRWLN